MTTKDNGWRERFGKEFSLMIAQARPCPTKLLQKYNDADFDFLERRAADFVEQERIRAKIEVYEEIEKMCSNQLPEHECIWKNCYGGIKDLEEQLTK